MPCSEFGTAVSPRVFRQNVSDILGWGSLEPLHFKPQHLKEVICQSAALRDKPKEETLAERGFGRKKTKTLPNCRKLAPFGLLTTNRKPTKKTTKKQKTQKHTHTHTKEKEGLGELGPFGPHLTLNLPKPKQKPQEKNKNETKAKNQRLR